MNNILLSVIIPVYNTQAFVQRCIESILQQSDERVELLCVDDASTDNSWEICSQLAAQNPRVKVYHHTNNQGPSGSRNTALTYARGKFITCMDSDDYWLPGTYPMFTPLLEKDFSLICATKYYEKYPSGKMMLRHHDMEINSQSTDLFSQIVRHLSRTGSWSNCLAFFRSSIIREHNLRYRENLLLAEDGEFFLEYCKYISSIAYVNEPYYVYCVNRTGSLMTSKKISAFDSYLKMILTRITDYQKHPTEQNRLILQLFTTNFLHHLPYYGGDKQLARQRITQLEQAHVLEYADRSKPVIKNIYRWGYFSFVRYGWYKLKLKQFVKNLVCRFKS